MYAIVEIAGQQFKVAKDQKVFVHRLEEKEGSKVSFDKVLLLDDGKVTIGAPVIENAVVTAKVLSHLKGDKVIVFKKKRRKGFKKKNGHRQYLSEILIELNKWMDDKEYKSLDDFRGKLSRKNMKDPFAYQRAQYVDILTKSDAIFKKYPMV